MSSLEILGFGHLLLGVGSSTAFKQRRQVVLIIRGIHFRKHCLGQDFTGKREIFGMFTSANLKCLLYDRPILGYKGEKGIIRTFQGTYLARHNKS